MPLRNRNTLKNFFKNGKSPSQTEFEDLIDSTWNKVDDGIDKTEAEGLKFSPNGQSSKIMSFYEGITDPDPNWQIAINMDHSKGLSIVQPPSNDSAERSSHGNVIPSMFFKDGDDKGHHKRVGIKTFAPKTEFDVAGNLCSNGRIGGFVLGRVPADANWHTIVPNLKGFNAFEIIAGAEGNKEEGNYSMAYAIALNTHGKGKIKITGSSYRWFDFRDKIRFRWRGSHNNYSLQIRIGKHYFFTKGNKYNFIRFHICRLWDSEVMKDKKLVKEIK